MERNLFGYLLDLERMMRSGDISTSSRIRELDHLLFWVEKLMREQDLISLSEVNNVFSEARWIMDNGLHLHITRAVILQALALRRMAKNPMVNGEELEYGSEELHHSMEIMEDLPVDRWMIDAYIEAGKAFERTASRTGSVKDIEAAISAYSKAHALMEQDKEKYELQGLEHRLKELRERF